MFQLGGGEGGEGEGGEGGGDGVGGEGGAEAEGGDGIEDNGGETGGEWIYCFDITLLSEDGEQYVSHKVIFAGL